MLSPNHHYHHQFVCLTGIIKLDWIWFVQLFVILRLFVVIKLFLTINK